jgi:hypothetical protein
MRPAAPSNQTRRDPARFAFGSNAGRGPAFDTGAKLTSTGSAVIN